MRALGKPQPGDFAGMCRALARRRAGWRVRARWVPRVFPWRAPARRHAGRRRDSATTRSGRAAAAGRGARCPAASRRARRRRDARRARDARCWRAGERRRRQSSVAQGRNAGTRRNGMCSGPSKAVSSRQKPNSNAGDGSGSSSSVAMCAGIAEARARLAGRVAIDEQHPASFERQRAGHRRTDNAGAYDGDRFLLRHSANVCELASLEKVCDERDPCDRFAHRRGTHATGARRRAAAGPGSTRRARGAIPHGVRCLPLRDRE